MLLLISCCEEGKLEATDSVSIIQPVPDHLLDVWLKDLERKGCYDRFGRHWTWKDMLIFPNYDPSRSPP